MKRGNSAVSEILGTVLMLMIAVSMFSVVYLVVFSYPSVSSSPSVDIVGTMEGSDIILEHRGGEALGLETKVLLTIDDERLNFVVGACLTGESAEDGTWDIGERLIYHPEKEIQRLQAEVMVIDMESNSAVMMGTIKAQAANLSINVTVDNPTPVVGAKIVYTVNVTNHGPDDAMGIVIKDLLPDNVTYDSNGTTQGVYNNKTCRWDVGSLSSGSSAFLNITATVTPDVEFLEFTQLAILLDGSSSVNDDDWNITRDGLAAAIADSYCFPHDGSVELTFIQFGGDQKDLGHGSVIPHARVEIGPIIVTEENYATVKNNISDIERIPAYDGETPIVCGFMLAADVLSGDPYGNLTGTPDGGKASPNFDPENRQIINLVTDGVPNCEWIPGTYNATWIDNNDTGHNAGKNSTEMGRNHSIAMLNMTEDQDEIDSLAVGVGGMYGGPDLAWLRDYIVWPQPGYIVPPFDEGSGWVREVDSWQNFSEAIDEQFTILFPTIRYKAEVLCSIPVDLYEENDFHWADIQPQPE